MSALAVVVAPVDGLRTMFFRARRAPDKAAEAAAAHTIRAEIEGRSIQEVAETCAACRRRRESR